MFLCAISVILSAFSGPANIFRVYFVCVCDFVCWFFCGCAASSSPPCVCRVLCLFRIWSSSVSSYRTNGLLKFHFIYSFIFNFSPNQFLVHSSQINRIGIVLHRETVVLFVPIKLQCCWLSAVFSGIFDVSVNLHIGSPISAHDVTSVWLCIPPFKNSYNSIILLSPHSMERAHESTLNPHSLHPNQYMYIWI